MSEPEREQVAKEIKSVWGLLGSNKTPRTSTDLIAYQIALAYWEGYLIGRDNTNPDIKLIKKRAGESWPFFLSKAVDIQLLRNLHKITPEG